MPLPAGPLPVHCSPHIGCPTHAVNCDRTSQVKACAGVQAVGPAAVCLNLWTHVHMFVSAACVVPDLLFSQGILLAAPIVWMKVRGRQVLPC